MHLLATSIGPVQPFIAAARRTADLHAGSQLLQKIVAAAAAAIPASDGTAFGPGLIFPVAPKQGGANKLLAVVPDGKAAAADVERAARARLLELWDDATESMGRTALDRLDDQRALSQIMHLLEIHSAWLPVDADSYPTARLEVEALLAGTKTVRMFDQQPGDDVGIPKSSLDPSRANVLSGQRLSNPPNLVDRPPLWLKSTELLDGVSLLKRAHATSRGNGLRNVLNTRELAQRTLEPEFRDEDEDAAPDFPYFAIFVADGDRMGEALGQLHTPQEHREFGRRLNAFAAAAPQIVSGNHGQLVYAGGDDVVALLPAAAAAPCAAALAQEFRERVGGTLSVGIAIVHYKEPLSGSLNRARHAERLAKRTRNALAIALHKRGGSPVEYTEQWSTDLRVNVWLSHHQQDRVARGVGYRLRALARELPSDAPPDIIQAEVRRVVSRSESDPSILSDLPRLADVAALDSFVSLLLITRFMSGVSRG